LLRPRSDRFEIRLRFVIGGVADPFIGWGSVLLVAIQYIEADGERMKQAASGPTRGSDPLCEAYRWPASRSDRNPSAVKIT
jgi:hypothetical protein